MSKKLIAIALAVTFAFSAVSVKADTLSDLQAIIASLTAQITALQGQTTGTVCFNTDLSQGMTANDVKNLQIVLNKNASTRVASSGAGSPGNETTYFGSLTLVAVKNFQASKVIVNTGYVGPLTRAALNALYCTPVVSYPAGCTSAVGFSSTTGLSCSGVVSYPAGCTSAVGFSTTTGLSCSGTVSYPAGCTSAVGFSSTTGLSCAGVVSVGATEGTLTITQNPLPGSGTVIVYGGNVQKEISAYKIKATNSDIRVKRVILQFNLVNNFPWRDLSAISIWDGTTMLKEVPATSAYFTEATFATIYTMTLDGLDVLVAKDTEKVLSVKATAVSVPATGGIALNVIIPANGVRGVDTSSLNVYGPAIGSPAQWFNTALAQAPTLTITAATDNPLAGNVIGDPANITRIDLLKISVKAVNIDMTWKGGTVNVTQSNATGSISAIELYDGTTLLAGAPGPGLNTTSTPCVFGTYTLAQAAGTTKTLTVKGVVVAAPTPGTVVSSILPAINGLVGVDSNSAAQWNATAVTGNNLTLYLIAPTFALNSASVVRSNSTTSTINDVGDFTIGIKVTANGGDIYLPTVNHATLGVATGTPEGFTPTINSGAGILGATTSYWSCDSVAIESPVVDDFTWRIPDGATSVCTENLNLTNTLTPGYYNVSMGSITWGPSVAALNGSAPGLINQATGLTALKAPATNLGI